MDTEAVEGLREEVVFEHKIINPELPAIFERKDEQGSVSK